MATNTLPITDNAWVELGTGLAACVLQGSGDVEVHVGSVAPSAGSAFFTIKSGEPIEIPQVAALGGGVWVRSVKPTGGVAYASA